MAFVISSLLLAVAVFTEGTSSATLTLSPLQINTTTKGTAFLQATVSDLSNSTLSWVVGDEAVVNVTVVVNGNVTSYQDEINANSTLYTASFRVIGSTNIQTNLTLNTLDLTFNGKMIKLKTEDSESSPAMLRVEVDCGLSPDSSVSSCTSLDCKATETTNDSSVGTGKFQVCNKTYTCQSPGNWALETASCTLVKCITPGKWGPSCDQDCGSGCPNGCASNGTCVDEAGMKVVPCATGYGGAMCDKIYCGDAPNDTVATCSYETCTAKAAVTDTQSKIYWKRSCNQTYICQSSGNWTMESQCGNYSCAGLGVWGPNCSDVCGAGCPGITANSTTKSCDEVSGDCTDPSTGAVVAGCQDGYDGDRCETPKCDQGCNGGTCLGPNYCGNCPLHFAQGPTCRNIKLDGFLKGALPSLFILAVIVIILTAVSKWHIRRKIKET